MSLIIFSAMLFLLAVFNYYITGTYLYPPVIFSIFWAGLLFFLALSGNMFYSISSSVLFIYLMGALAFSTGAILPIIMRRTKKVYNLNIIKNEYSNAIINIGLIVSIFVFPYYCFKLYKIASSSAFSNLYVGLRYEMAYGGASIGGWLAYFTSFVRFLAIFSYLDSKNSKSGKIRAYMLIILSLMYTLFSMQRLGAVLLIFAILGVELISEKKVNFRFVLNLVIILLIIFAIPAILLGKGGVIGISLLENLRGVLNSLMVYLLGGVVAFDNVVKNPELYAGPRLTTFRFIFAFLDRIGLANYDLPKFIPVYTYTPAPTNVYTIYFSYFLDYGYMGIFILLFIIGFFSSTIFISAYFKRSKNGIFLYGMVISALLISNVSEAFFIPLSYWLQAVIFLFFVCKFPTLIRPPVEDTKQTNERVKIEKA